MKCSLFIFIEMRHALGLRMANGEVKLRGGSKREGLESLTVMKKEKRDILCDAA